jgi:signal peptidase I
MAETPAAAASSRPRARARARRKRRGGAAIFIRDLIVIIAIAVVASFLIKTFLVRSFFIPSASMENTLQIHDRILVNELVPGLVPLQRGDVVVFKDPGGWLEASEPVAQPPAVAAVEWVLSLVGLSTADSNDHLIKRVIGLPGDHVTCCNALGQMSVNGTPLDEPYAVLPPGTTDVSSVHFDVTVPKDRLWVMGDNRYNSKDSRFNRGTPTKGFVPTSDLVGRAFVVSWPLNHWQYLSNHPETFGGVPAPR